MDLKKRQTLNNLHSSKVVVLDDSKVDLVVDVNSDHEEISRAVVSSQSEAIEAYRESVGVAAALRNCAQTGKDPSVLADNGNSGVDVSVIPTDLVTAQAAYKEATKKLEDAKKNNADLYELAQNFSEEKLNKLINDRVAAALAANQNKEVKTNEQ